MMPGRRIASPASIAAADALAEASTSVAEKASAIELTPNQIAKLVASDRATWIARAQELVAAATRALNATEKKDAEALLDSGDAIDAACEHCHLKYWYPKNKK